MKAVFINHCHPEMPHVCGLRLSRFADAMAARGHQIVLVTETYPRDTPGMTAAEMDAALDRHDWARPLHVPVRSEGFEAVRRARDGEVQGLSRRLTVARTFLAHNGMFPDWQAGAAPLLAGLADGFKPDVVWATFGNTDAWTLAQSLARQATCPWVADFKDNWSAFMPFGMARLIAGRLSDASHMTVLSEGHCDEAERYFHGRKTVLYSGVDRILAGAVKDGPFRITYAGSIYAREHFRLLMEGIAAWQQKARPGDVVFRYAGNDTERVGALCEGLDGAVRHEMLGYVSPGELAAIQANSHVNVYVQNDRCILHHKSLELIAAGRPIICMPTESAETRRLAGEVGASLFVCTDAAEVADALDAVANAGLPMPPSDALAPFTWQNRAQALEDVLTTAAGGGS